MATVPMRPEATTQVPLVTVQEYLESSYEPDVDYLEGVLEERNVGEWDHGRLQIALAGIFLENEAEWEMQVVPETRLQVSESRFRVPDVMVVRTEDVGPQIVRTPPLLCVEVLSPRDTWRTMEKRIEDYIRMGVRNIWVFDPASREIFVMRTDSATGSWSLSLSSTVRPSVSRWNGCLRRYLSGNGQAKRYQLSRERLKAEQAESPAEAGLFLLIACFVTQRRTIRSRRCFLPEGSRT